MKEAPDTQTGPAIYGDIVVWTDHRNENYDIYGSFFLQWNGTLSVLPHLVLMSLRPDQGFLNLVLIGLEAFLGIFLTLVVFFMRLMREKEPLQ